MIHLYSALGNIIVLFPALPPLKKHTAIIKALLSKAYFDQIIYYERTNKQCNTIIQNRDGSYAQQCGNGLRALAHHLRQPRLDIVINNNAYLALQEDGCYWVDMGAPSFVKQLNDLFEVSLGNNHIISLSPTREDLIKQWSQTHNISFVQQVTQNTFKIKTYERGCGWTACCASASTAASIALYKLSPQHIWHALHDEGTLNIHKQNRQWLQTGPVEHQKIICRTEDI
ncbi:hypothetical protein MMH89_04730 [Candidatus Comchoanobacter bicostacola]|uniref:diaminopimelate epimerase n=1 Tax=Candidatus Comchoanobacter bicostacola TaxID=2919598 RepID=A0ABY5DL32_9GAMM|nr:hypothetical protein [Candidatus Comchoanobacter bicostacola]UTC24521.1 hypothetical protein MMH89_04730 [Candidatus Comchoanobacter bicostacola]